MGTMHPLVKAKNDSSSENSQEIPVSMDNMCPDKNENLYVTSTSGEASAPVVGNHGKLGPCPHPWRRGGTAHRITAVCLFMARYGRPTSMA